MQNSLKQFKSRGFTIVELLIVIVVIGILATITIITYNGVQKGAVDAGVNSDLDGISNAVAHYQVTHNGVLDSSVAWYSGSGANATIGFTPTSGNIIDVVVNSTDYCIRGYNPNSKTYTTLATAATKGSTPGACATLSPSAAAIAVSPIPLVPNAGYVSTLAGGTQGTANGTGSSAQFSSLDEAGVVADSSGNVFVTDNNQIRKITPDGTVSSFAGSTSGASGSSDGTGSSALFNDPQNLAIDSSNNIYLADYNNNLIRKITPAGVVTTFAGITGGTCADTNGTLAVAKFCEPSGIAIDSSGTVYVSDTGYDVIRKITGGTVSTLAGSSYGYKDATGTSAKFNYPMSLAVDGSGNVYVADYANYVIRKITPAGVVTTFAGNHSNQYTQDGTGTGAAFSAPWGITIDSAGNLYVTDYAYIREITTPGAVVTTLAGSGWFGFVDGPHNTAQFAYPRGIGIQGSTLFVADSQYYAIRKVK